jgi:hypothetical protein
MDSNKGSPESPLTGPKLSEINDIRYPDFENTDFENTDYKNTDLVLIWPPIQPHT